MTIILPENDGIAPGGLSPAPVSTGTPGPVPKAGSAGIGARDFGESLIRPIDAVRQAAETCLVDCSLHDATQAFDAFTDDLTLADGDFEAWPDRFAAEAKRVRDEFASRIPDGPSRDRFDAGFDLFAKAKAVETRGLATQKRIATNRAELDRALAGYSETISRALNPVSADFALTQGDAAIRNQVAAKVLSEDEGAALSRRYRDDIAVRRARQFTEDDPEDAARELRKDTGGLFADLDPARRQALAGHADRTAAARKADLARARNAEERRGDAEAALRRDAFLRDLDDRAENGAATLADISAAARDGVLTPDEADTRMASLERSLADRETAAARVAGLMNRPGEFLNPDDADDRRAADIHWWDTVLPLLEPLPGAERVDFEDAVILNTGVAPKPAAKGVLAGLLSGDPASRVAAARRVHKWLLAQPPIPVDIHGLRIPEFETLRPYLDLALPDGRKIELAEDAIMRLEVGEAPPRPQPLGSATGEARIEKLDSDSAPSAEDGTPAAGDGGGDETEPVVDPERQQELEDRLSDPETRDALRDQLLKDLEAEAERSDLSPAEVLERQQEIRDALPADPSKGTQVAIAPVIAVGGAAAARMLLSPGAISSALTAIGLGKFAASEPGGFLSPAQSNEIPDGNTTGDGISRRTEDDDGGGRGRGRSDDDGVSGGASAGDPGDDPPEERRRGRKARDSSKDERKGDLGRKRDRIKDELEEAEKAARKLPRKERNKALQKIRNRKFEAERRKRGEEHSRRGKGNR